MKDRLVVQFFDPVERTVVRVSLKEIKDYVRAEEEAVVEEETVVEEAQEAVEEETKQPDIYPKSTGGSWYQLSNGKKVQGKTKALKLQKELDNAGF